ncbi:methyl-accepting chemotaxis protein [Ruminiclostridium herbifermentans]|uniref:Methyl-accepting chemotaxis protein n=1 Tax=Ruminiclostridium herbifermentans TaxID=2488810 RepID=A0A4U7JK33_9FIRM|nr:methyl-accepting chemotaxis protein [Ruminiclostridium herbifermentans]QNU65545.1 methyl-accepting chemotaxis protein [Ruminiclostridium herbifermentans]
MKFKLMKSKISALFFSIASKFSKKRKTSADKNISKPPKISSKFIFLRRFKIKTRLIASFVLLLVAVILITGIFSYNSSTQTIDDKVKRYSLQVMEQTSVILDGKIERMEAYINDVGLDRNIQNAIIKYNEGNAFDKYDQVKSIMEYLMTKFVADYDVEYCAILHGEDFSQVQNFNRGQAELDAQKIAGADFKQLTWWDVNFVESNKQKSYYGITQNIKGVNSGGVIAKMVVIPKPNYLASGFEKLDIGKDLASDTVFPIFVVDDEGRILATRNAESYTIDSSNDNSKLITSEIKKAIEDDTKQIEILKDLSKTKPLTDSQKLEIENLQKSYKSGNIDINVDGVNSLVTYSRIGKKNWYVVSVIPYNYLNSDANELRTNIILIGSICILFAFLLCILIARSVSKPLYILVSAMKKVKDGDLTEHVADNGKDEIADVCNNYNDMLSNICSLINKVRDASKHVFDSANKITLASESTYSVSEQVAQSVAEVAMGASDQAMEINESVTDISKLSEGITLVEENVTKVIEIANKISGLNEVAASTISELNTKSAQVSETTNKVYTNINELSNSMKEIQKILKMQNTISEQTNLLSLNAAIEAARAGDAGRGFAVVASEVSKLAEKSKEFNSLINNIISSIGKKTKDTVNEVLKSNDVVNEQINSVKGTENLFETVFGSMKDVLTNIELTEKSVENIMMSKNSVLESIGNISAVAQESAAATEQISASTQEQISAAQELSYQAKDLERLSETLNKEISKFRIE